MIIVMLTVLVSLIESAVAGEVYANGGFTEIVKGVAYSPHMPGEGCLEFGTANYAQDFEWMQDANINIIRTYDWVPEEILDNATQYNIKVIEGIWIPTGGNFSDASFKDSCKTHITEVLNRDRDKCCIIGWCLGNELHVDAVDRAGKEETERFLKELYEYTRSRDPNPNHFITHANWPPLDDLDMSFFDVVGFNVYSYWPAKVSYKGYSDYVRSLKAKYPDQPLLITEFGYSTSPIGEGNFGYGGNSEEMQATSLAERWNDLIAAGCAGGIVFEWNDEWWKNDCFSDDKNTHDSDNPEEWFGIIAVEGDLSNYSMRKKPAYYAVQKMFWSEKRNSARSTPGFGILIGVFGLIIVTYLMRKRGGDING